MQFLDKRDCITGETESAIVVKQRHCNGATSEQTDEKTHRRQQKPWRNRGITGCEARAIFLLPKEAKNESLANRACKECNTVSGRVANGLLLINKSISRITVRLSLAREHVPSATA